MGVGVFFVEVDHFNEMMLFSSWTSANGVKVTFLKIQFNYK